MKRKTKIVCTIGPAIDSPEMIEKIINAGMNVGRLNFSHGNPEEHKKRIEMIRSIAKDLNRYIGIMA
ncbi:MAG: pyruvate kinase, partial [Tenericutes bacterium HGW-Tenericutes-5]